MNINLIKNVEDLLVLFSSFTWGVYSIINKKFSLNHSPLMTILYLFILMALIIIPFNINQKAIDSIFHLSTVSWISILFLGLLCSGVSNVI